MTVPLSKVEIANIALDYIGERSISSVDSPSNDVEALISRNYDTVREDLLRQHTWNFAKRTVELSYVRAGEADYDSVFALPADFIRFESVDPEAESPTDFTTRYDIRGRELYVDAGTDDDGNPNTVVIRYIANVVDLSLWAPDVKIAFAISLAEKICFALTKSNTRQQFLAQLETEQIRKCKQVDGTERPPIKRQRSVILARRRTMGIGSVGLDPSKEYPFD